jgi:hypothetical protein
MVNSHHANSPSFDYLHLSDLFLIELKAKFSSKFEDFSARQSTNGAFSTLHGILRAEDSPGIHDNGTAQQQRQAGAVRYF